MSPAAANEVGVDTAVLSKLAAGRVPSNVAAHHTYRKNWQHDWCMIGEQKAVSSNHL